MNDKGTATFNSLYVVTDNLILNEKAKIWCKLPYPSHPHGCPNYGKKDICPPRAPDVRDVLDFNESMFFVVIRFDIGEHARRMKEKHPGWTDRQAHCLLYWQPKVVKALHEEVGRRAFVVDSLSNKITHIVTYVPEAMGVDVFGTCKLLGIPIERNPIKYVHKVALVGRPRNETR